MHPGALRSCQACQEPSMARTAGRAPQDPCTHIASCTKPACWHPRPRQRHTANIMHSGQGRCADTTTVSRGQRARTTPPSPWTFWTPSRSGLLAFWPGKCHPACTLCTDAAADWQRRKHRMPGRPKIHHPLHLRCAPKAPRQPRSLQGVQRRESKGKVAAGWQWPKLGMPGRLPTLCV